MQALNVRMGDIAIFSFTNVKKTICPLPLKLSRDFAQKESAAMVLYQKKKHN